MCRGVAWGYELRVIQLAAVCIGGLGLSAICRALSVNYKQLASGQPDLLMVRVRSTAALPASDEGPLPTIETPQGSVVDLGAWLGETLFDKPASEEIPSDDADLTLLDSAPSPQLQPLDRPQQQEGHVQSQKPRPAVSFTYVGDDLDVAALAEGWVAECMFVEVKGPSDALADKQRLWLQILSSCGLTAFVCKVREGMDNQPKGSHADHASNKKRRMP